MYGPRDGDTSRAKAQHSLAKARASYAYAQKRKHAGGEKSANSKRINLQRYTPAGSNKRRTSRPGQPMRPGSSVT